MNDPHDRDAAAPPQRAPPEADGPGYLVGFLILWCLTTVAFVAADDFLELLSWHVYDSTALTVLLLLGLPAGWLADWIDDRRKR